MLCSNPFLADTAPDTLSRQQFVDCTFGYETGRGTELVRKNQGCKTGYADVHLLWLYNGTQSRLQTEQEFPLEPNRLDIRPGNPKCINNADQFGFGPNFYNNRQRQVCI